MMVLRNTSMYLKKILFIAIPVLLLNTPVFALQTGSNETSNFDAESCSLEAFLASDFIRTSVWPGIGPFHSASNETNLVDPSGNQLTYSALGKQINSCQLELRAGPNEAQSILNLQMSVDFLLEGLGAKPGQIHIVNTEVTKNSKLLVGNNYNPVQTIISPLVVSFQNLGVSEGTDTSKYRVVVVNKNLSAGNVDHPQAEDQDFPKAITSIDQYKHENIRKEEDTKEVAAGVPEVVINKPSAETVNKKTVTARANSTAKPWFQIEKTTKTEPKESKVEMIKGSQITQENTENANGENQEVVEPVPKVVSTPKVLNKDEQLKKEFQDVIQNWQSLKKTAIKERKGDLLSQALAGKALIRQSDAIKWLVNNHKYYDMTPGGAQIEKIEALVSGKKYAVYAVVKEKTKFVDEATKQVLKETDDTYKVNYTIEKIGEHWLITDSALIKASASKSAEPKTSGTKAPASKSAESKPANSTTTKSVTRTSH